MVGSATVFSTTNGGLSWTQKQSLEGSSSASGDWFGNSVSLFGNTIAVGVHLDDAATGDAGEFSPLHCTILPTSL